MFRVRVRVSVTQTFILTLTLGTRKIKSQAVNSKPTSHTCKTNTTKIFERRLGWKLTYIQLARIEPLRDKTNKMTVRPANTQVSLGIRPL